MSGETLSFARAFERWYAVAQDLVDDVRGCRQPGVAGCSPWAMPTTFQGKPCDFLRDTMTLYGVVARRYPHLDARPIQQLYDAALRWSTTHAPRDLPSQVVLESRFEAAMMTLATAREDLIRRMQAGPEAAEVPDAAGPKADAKPERNPRPKRSTSSGEARAKLVAALTRHHRYDDGSALNTEPIGCAALARLAGVSAGSASAFFRREFRGHTLYRVACGDAARLAAALRLLNGDYSPHVLYGGTPRGEESRPE